MIFDKQTRAMICALIGVLSFLAFITYGIDFTGILFGVISLLAFLDAFAISNSGVEE